VPKDVVEGYMWTKLAANQGNEKALSYLPTMEAELTEDELVAAQSKVSKFRPVVAKKKKPVYVRHLRRDSSDTARANMTRFSTGY